jgi:hypothetical protein
MISERLRAKLKKKRCTLLGVGPMSLNCVDAAIELANDHDVPIFLIASRRQIESKFFGGGYVNNWDTANFAKYVISEDANNRILLARDHGGPWQNPQEIAEGYSLRQAMDSAKASYQADIDAGFQVLHIDPSIDIHKTPSIEDTLDRIYELYEYCWIESQKQNKEVIFEIGTEEQSGSTNTQEELDFTLKSVTQFCSRNKLPLPTFVVIQTGTRVMEMKNIGSFDSPIRIGSELPAEIQIPKMIEICNRYGVLMKEHNTDYLSDDALRWHPRFGIHASNVAPEFGVVESKALLGLLEYFKLNYLAEKFLAVSYNSRKWEKWMLPNSIATDRERAIISGHYVFSRQEVREIKMEATGLLAAKNIDLENHLKGEVKNSIMRYLKNFRLIGSV